MNSRLRRAEAPVCQLCTFIGAKPVVRPRNIRSSIAAKTIRNFSAAPKPALKSQKYPSQISRQSSTTATGTYDGAKLSGAVNTAKVEDVLHDAEVLTDKLLSSEGSPKPSDVNEVMKQLEQVAEKVMAPQAPATTPQDGSEMSALLSLNKGAAKSSSVAQNGSSTAKSAAAKLEQLALSVLEHPPIFITPNVLKRYVNIMSILKKPETLPGVFDLYANKPIPIEGSKPVKYKQANPKKASSAVEKPTADIALQTALDAKDLQAAMDIVETSYNTTAFRRAKFVRKAMVPVVGLGLAPVAAYAIAGKLATYQTTMDPSSAQNIAFVGILGYIGFTATTAVVAITTANDQMVRITWAPGMPLRERWMREEERFAIDQIAQAWGFEEVWRRGEEEGEEWEAIREWAGRKGMILDKSNLMEGME
jgi:hypothetical protein